VPGRIVLYGATGYIRGLTARAMVAGGARPVLAGRDQGRLNALAERLSRNSDGVKLETANARGRRLATVRLTGGDPYSFTPPVLAWAAGRAAAQGVRPAGALGPAEAFGLASLERACAEAGFHRKPGRKDA